MKILLFKYLKIGKVPSYGTILFIISILGNTNGQQVEPIISTHWGQNGYLNELCPNWCWTNLCDEAPAGCVAIALAQILYYFQYPSSPSPLQLNYQIWRKDEVDPISGNNYKVLDVDLSGVVYNWQCQNTSLEEIQEIVYHSGLSCFTDYHKKGGSEVTQVWNICNALENIFNYRHTNIIILCTPLINSPDCFEQEIFEQILRDELDETRPVILIGTDLGRNSTHAMIVDGYNETNQFHINIGGGIPALDTYYYLDNINPSIIDPTQDNYNWTDILIAIINIEPDVEVIPCNMGFPYETISQDLHFTRNTVICPELQVPIPFSLGNSNIVEFTWNKVAGAIGYCINVKSLSTGVTYVDSVRTYSGNAYYEDNSILPYNDTIQVEIFPIDSAENTVFCSPFYYLTDTTNCALRILSATPLCINDSSFNLSVNFTGIQGHTYDLWIEDTTGVLMSLNNVAQGEYLFGPISTSASIATVVEDEAQPYDCYHGIGVERIRCVFCPEIGLSVTSNYCIADVINLNVNLEVDTSTIIDLYTTIEGVNTFNDVESGNYTFTNIPSGEDFLVIAEDTSKPYDCNRIIFVEAQHCYGDSNETVIQTLEYFIDIDPGYGNGSTIPTPSSYNLVINHAINLDTLNPGVHILYIRAMDELGLWGYTVRKLFYIRPETESQNRLLSNLEYFIDTDPGLGLGIPLTLENTTNSIDSYLLPLDTLNPGIHVLYVRGKDNAGNWSFTSRKLFYIRPEAEPTNRLLTSLEYFIDSDPGAGMGTPLTLENDTNSIDSYLLPLDTIASGIHVLYVRGKDNAGSWSFTSRKLFYIRPEGDPSNRLLTSLEYFIDTDPGAGMGIPLTLENDTNSIDSYLLPLDTITPGVHVLYVRGKDNAGNWSYTSRKLFYIRPGSESPNRLLTDLEYFIDNDPGFGLGTPLALDNDTNSIALYDIALESFTPGLHHLFVRGKDNQGDWGFTIVKPFTIYVLGPIIYVDWDASGSNIGTSWTNAFSRLEPALILATLYDTIQEIWIAQGVYKPTTTTDRNFSFTWADSTKLYGGFIGTETERNQRTPNPALVVLSGDIGISGDSTDNTYHVVVIDSTCQGCYLDRLTIKLGNASSSTNNNDKGAGIYSMGYVEIKDVVVEYSSAALTGAAIYNIGSGADLRMMNCTSRFNNSPIGYDVHNASGANILIQGGLQLQD